MVWRRKGMTRMNYKLLAIVCLSLAFFIPSACGINIAGSSNGAGFSVSMDLGVNDRLSMSAILGQNSVSSAIEGTGDLKEYHWVANHNGAFASVGVDIDNSTDYSYSYSLVPGSRLRKSETVEASESLDVIGADRISASAQARNGKGYSVSTGVDITQGSLKGYSNHALASNDEVKVSQEFLRAEGDAVRLISTTGTWRSPKGKQPLWIAVRQGSDNPSEGSIDTEVAGIITGYRDNAAKFQDLSEINQNGHVEGAFRSTAIVGIESITRNSNYGTMYDLDMQAKIDGRFPKVSGTLGYYVDNVSPGANRIQGAVDAAESGDAINVLPGTYFENVVVDKSLDVLGAGVGETVVDGNHKGSVFKIGTDNSDIDVTLSGMAITNGSGKAGGIYNEGRTTIKHCLVHRNKAYSSGGGISNSGTITVTGSNISENTGYDGGGIYNEGIAVITCSNILKNKASGFGGGIQNRGSITITGSNISENTVEFTGGGIFNYALANITNSILLGNTALGYGGGLCNGGIAMVKGGNISKNSAAYGGGINSWGTVTVTGNAITGNKASLIGGGIHSEGTTIITDNTISHNSARNGGGVYISVYEVTIAGGNISENQATEDGGGVYNSGRVNILENSTITHNIADSDNDGIGTGGGIYWYDMYSTLNFIDANGDGIVDPNAIVFDNYLGNGDANNIEPPL
jgi:hypothetical protein